MSEYIHGGSSNWMEGREEEERFCGTEAEHRLITSDDHESL